MIVFKRFPKLHPLPKDEQHIVPLNERSSYPAFAKDFDKLDDILMPTFRKLDNEALKRQNSYRWAYIILIFGGSLATIFGIVQIAFQTIDWPGYVEAFIAALLVGSTAYSHNFNSHERYLNARLAAEQLRSTYFLYLRRHHPFEDEKTREDHLQQQVDDIEQGVRN